MVLETAIGKGGLLCEAALFPAKGNVLSCRVLRERASRFRHKPKDGENGGEVPPIDRRANLLLNHAGYRSYRKREIESIRADRMIPKNVRNDKGLLLRRPIR
jgi:hypothetical protein